MIPTIYAWLHDYAPLAAIVGTRIYGSGVASPDSIPPRVVWQLVAKDSPMYLGQPQDCDWDRVQIHCWSADEAQAAQLADLCRAALSTYGNLVGGVIADHDTEAGLYRAGFDWAGWRDIT